MMEKVQYREERGASKHDKENYVSGIEKLIADREKIACEKRNNYVKEIFQNQDKYREEFKKMLGWPLTDTVGRTVPMVQKEKLAEEKECIIYRMSIQVIEEFNITGLFFQKKNQKRPLVIVQHGGDGTPELVSNLYGNTANYNEMAERVMNQNVHVFAPQLLLWKNETYHVEYNRIELDARLKRVGSSITALEVYAIMRILDYFEAQDYVTNFGMVGLSYGGFYTLFTTAIDTRIKSAVSCSFYNTRSEIAWPDWTWQNAAENFCDAEVACLVYPRRLCIEVGLQDESFKADGANAEICRLKELCHEVGTDWFDYIEFDGNHEFCKDDFPLKRLADDLK